MATDSRRPSQREPRNQAEVEPSPPSQPAKGGATAASRLRQLVEESQGGGYTSWVDQYGKEVVGLDTHQGLVDDHTEMGRLVLDLLEGEE